MNEIHILPDFIANQIAAGEVVQRPESVVKELVENSMDSQADSVAVIVRNAGKQLIHVIDNGKGINKDDLPLTIKRHATSKIFSQEDMERILTYGFRGEALASISSVAQLELRTKRQGDDVGYSLVAEPNGEPAIMPVNTEIGTQVFVRNLFYNIPARRKFLKSNLTEFRHISDSMLKFALSRTDIRFTFYDGENLVFDVKPSSLESRISDLLGASVAENMIPVSYTNENIDINGFVGEPQQARQASAQQFLFLNGRNIRSKYLNHAVIAAYEYLIDKNYYPFYLLNIKIDPKNIDVNVHPQKHEVKFEDERYVYNTVKTAVTMALNSRNLIPDISLPSSDASSPFIINTPDGNFSGREIVNKMTGEIIEPFSRGSGSGQSQDFQGSGMAGRPFSFESKTTLNRYDRELSAYEALFGTNEENKADAGRDLLFIRQVLNNYIIAETAGSIIVIDQKRAHCRILYERQLKKIDFAESGTQSLLYPVAIALTNHQSALLDMIKDEIMKLGFEWAHVDGGISLTGIPQDLKPGREDSFIIGLIEGCDGQDLSDKSKYKHRIALIYAQRNSVDSGKPLTDIEIKTIYHDLGQCVNKAFTPDGKKISFELTQERIENLIS